MGDQEPSSPPYAEEPLAAELLPEEPGKGFLWVYGWIKRPENFTPLGAVLFFLLMLFWAPELVERSKTIREWIQEFLAAGFVHDGTNLKSELHPWMAVFFILLAAILFVLGCSTVAGFLLARSLRKERNRLAVARGKLAHDIGELRTERDLATGAITQLETLRTSLSAQIEAITTKLEETAAERDKGVGALTQLATERRELQAAFEAREAKFKQIVDATIYSSSKIRSKLFPTAASSTKTFEEVHIVYHIARNFDADVRKRFVLRAGADPLHFWQHGTNSSEDANPAEMFPDINFRLINLTPDADVAYLPTKDEPHAKSACIFFLPRVEPGESREIEISFQWKGLFLKMLRDGWEDFSDQLKTGGTVNIYSLEIYLEPGTGGTIQCEETGVTLPGKRLENVVSHRGWPGWKYSAKNIPVELLQTEITLQCRWQKS